MSIPDYDDRALFQSTKVVEDIIRLKHNDPELTYLELPEEPWSDIDKIFDGKAWRCLGDIIGKNEFVEVLSLWSCNLDMTGLFAGLQHNRSIKRLILSNVGCLRFPAAQTCLGQFLSMNPVLECIALHECNIGPEGIANISTALLNRREHSLKAIDLSQNSFGDVDLDTLVLALGRNRDLVKLNLYGTGIGQRACLSLAGMLRNQESSLQQLHLSQNNLSDESIGILCAALAENRASKLEVLALEDDNLSFTAAGWSAVLNLVCNMTSMNNAIGSNHTLVHIGMSTRSSGYDGSDLLNATLWLNKNRNKALVARIKVIWSHVRGNINIGAKSVPSVAMPDVLACIWEYNGDFSDPDDSDDGSFDFGCPAVALFQENIQLGAIYRILQSRPSLLHHGCSKERERLKTAFAEVKALRDENKGLRDEIKRLRDAYTPTL